MFDIFSVIHSYLCFFELNSFDLITKYMIQ
jgi:hypothetical protein